MRELAANEGKKTEEEVQGYISEIEYYFDKYLFSILGGKSTNPFHYEGKLVAHRIANRLHKYGLIESNSVESAIKLVGRSITGLYESSSIKNHDLQALLPKEHPDNSRGYTLDTLRENLEEALAREATLRNENPLTVAQEAELFSLIDDLDRKTQQYWHWFSEFSEPSGEEWEITDEEREKFHSLSYDQRKEFERRHEKYHFIVRKHLRNYPELTLQRSDTILKKGYQELDTRKERTEFLEYYRYRRYLIKKYNRREKYANADIFLKLLFSNDALSQLVYPSDLSGLLGYKSTNVMENHLKGKSTPKLPILSRMKFVVSKWTMRDFELFSEKVTYKTNVELNEFQLKHAQLSVSREVNTWISRGTRIFSLDMITGKRFKIIGTYKYIASNFKRHNTKYTREDIMPEYRFVETLLNYKMEMEYLNQKIGKERCGEELLVSELDISASFKDLKRFLGRGMNVDMNKHTREGMFFNTKTVEAVIQGLRDQLLAPQFIIDYDFIEEGGLDLIDTTIMKVYQYADERGHSLFMPSQLGNVNEYDKRVWYDRKTKGYHLVFKLCEFLGFDPLFFQELGKDIFKHYHRHHFRDDPYRKQSYHMSDVVLTHEDLHQSYEKYIGHEGFIEAIFDTLKELIASSKKDLDDADFKKCLRKHMNAYYEGADIGDATERKEFRRELRRWVLSEFGEKDYDQVRLDEFESPAERDEAVVDGLVAEVWDKWTRKGEVKGMKKFKDAISKFNDRRNDYARTGNYLEFLQEEYNMDKTKPENSYRYLRNAADLHILLRKDRYDILGITEEFVRQKYIEPDDYAWIESHLPIFQDITSFI